MGSATLLWLQRAVGNQAVCRLMNLQPPDVIQRKPADINSHWNLDYDSTGALTNVAAPRAILKRATAINSQMRYGLVTPLEELTGGHLFKREFGGPDDETNVVPWKQAVEDDFTDFEDDYIKAAKIKADAAAGASTPAPYRATVHTQAKFVDRPDLAATASDLDNAGWTSPDAERDKRRKLFADVEEKFSGIPTSVSVGVTIEPTDVRTFTRAGTDIAPVYTRNDAALAPGYAMQSFTFQRGATQPRQWKDADWTNQADKIRKQLQHEWKHAGDFGIAGGFNPTKGKAFEAALKTFVMDPSHEQIVGAYRKTNVLHYVDATGVWVSTLPDGTLTTAWKLDPDQLNMLLTKGQVR